MSRTVEGEYGAIPAPPDVQAWRHFGDGFAGHLTAARIQGYDSGNLAYVDVAVDSSGVLQTSGGGGGGSVTQGTSPWVISGAVTASWASAQHVIVDTAPTTAVTIASMPSTPVTGPLTDTQLRASAVPVSLAALPALAAGSAVIGHVIVDTAPSTAVTNAGTFAVQATLAAETTKVIGTVNQGTSPWVTSRNWTLGSGTDSVSASVSNFPATQPVSGSVSVSNFPATQVVDGSAVTQPVADATANDHLSSIRSSLNELAFAAILDAERSLFT